MAPSDRTNCFAMLPGTSGLAAALLAAGVASAQTLRLGPLVQISGPNPIAGCDTDGTGPGPVPDDTDSEPWVAVNPADERNIVATWILGKSRGIAAAVTLDGGRHWQETAIPGLAACTGGAFAAAIDPWASFGPTGDLYVSCIFFNRIIPGDGIEVIKSTDGGLHWGAPTLLIFDTSPHIDDDQPRVTADPTDPRFVYVVWTRFATGNGTQVMLARSTDAGQSSEPARPIYAAAHSSDKAFGHQIVVLPSGELINFFTEYSFTNGNGGDQKTGVMSLIRSTDKGVTWSAHTRPMR